MFYKCDLNETMQEIVLNNESTITKSKLYENRKELQIYMQKKKNLLKIGSVKSDVDETL